MFLELLTICGVLIFTQASPVVNTTLGPVRGFTQLQNGITVNTYLGIPYAQPPLGTLRFQPPVSAKPWNETYNATTQPNACPQINILNNKSRGAEDCLYLNIWTPKTKDKYSRLMPVMVWIYGGSFAGGSIDETDASFLVAQGKVVLVAMNYRVGAFGFLNALTRDAPGNIGLLDQLLALEWVRKNVEAFGGDPDEITLFGESAGSMSVHLHILSPRSSGLFKKAIMESGSVYSRDFAVNLEESLDLSNTLSKNLKCADEVHDIMSDPVQVVNCLRKKAVQEILNATADLNRKRFIPLPPTYGTSFLPLSPIIASKRGIFNNVDLLLGTTTQDGSVFLETLMDPKFTKDDLSKVTADELLKQIRRCVNKFGTFGNAIDYYLDKVQADDKQGLRREAVDYASDIGFVCPTVYFAERFSDRSNNVFVYQFAYRSAGDNSPKWLGVKHSDDVAYVFGRPFLERNSYTPEDRDFSSMIMDMWTTFARKGTMMIKTWPKYNRNNTLYVNINATLTVLDGPRNEYCRYLQQYF